MKPDQRERLTTKTDPSAKSVGRPGVLPVMSDEEKDRAFSLLDERVSAQMDHDYEHGRKKGETTNNRFLDPYFTWMPGYTNVFTGWPFHGKSQFVFEQLVNRAAIDFKPSVVWPSENLPAQRFYDNLIHTFTGRSVDKSIGNCLSLAEYRKAREFIREYFIALDVPNGMPYTPAHLLGYFERAIAKHKVEHSMIDPFNKCDNTAQLRMGGPEAYAAHVLGLCTKWSQDTNQCLILTAHPKRANEGMGYRQTRPVPNGGMISGGQMWENMPHYVGTVHRPFPDDEGSTAAAFYCQKSKDERLVGRRGNVGGMGREGEPPAVPINWGSASNRYYWGTNRFNPLDCDEVRALWEVPPTPALPAALATPPPPTWRPAEAPATIAPITSASTFDLPADYHPNGRPVRLNP